MKKEALNATIVLFGGTGDLTKRKIVPALANTKNFSVPVFRVKKKKHI